MSVFGAITGVLLFLFVSFMVVKFIIVIVKRFEDRKNEKFEKRRN